MTNKKLTMAQSEAHKQAFAQWQLENDDLLLPGLDNVGKTYIKLQHKHTPMLEVDLAFKPQVSVTGPLLVLGGKLSVFPCKGTEKAEAVSDEVRIQWLEAAFPKFDFVKRDPHRVGTLLLGVVRPSVLQAAKGGEDPPAAIAGLVESLTTTLLDEIATTGAVQIEQRERVQAAITTALTQCVRNLLGVAAPGGSLPDNVVSFSAPKKESL